MKMTREKIYHKSWIIESRLKYLCAAIFVVMTLASCSDEQRERTEDRIDNMADDVENRVDKIQDNMQENRDENFVENVVEMNNEELHMLDEAIAKGTSADVKSAARKMKSDHEKLGRDMMDYAQRKNMTLDPDHDHDDINQDKPGADWDRKWADHMVDEHEKLVRKFENGSTELNDPELRTMVADALPTLKNHLETARGLKEKLKK